MTKQGRLSGSTLIETNGVRFLITERPKERNLLSYVEELRKYGVSDLVRVCESSYSTAALLAAGIEVHNLSFEDGGSPPKPILDQWLTMIQHHFVGSSGGCIAVHCVAGLGRAPVLVAIALIENGMKYEEAITFIRSRRHGAFNTNQIMFLERYKRSRRKKNAESCSVM